LEDFGSDSIYSFSISFDGKSRNPEVRLRHSFNPGFLTSFMTAISPEVLIAINPSRKPELRL